MHTLRSGFPDRFFTKIFQDDLENSTDDPTLGLEWSRGIFITPEDEASDKDTARIGETCS